MKKNKKIGLSLVLALVAVLAFVGIRLNQPAYSLTMDVNPSIEIVSNRLDKVVQVNPLNKDAREMLKDFKIKDRNLKDTIEDLADLMVLKGYISGGKDNLVMITVNDNAINQDSVDKLNSAIVAYLENKQIEATVFNQAIDKKYEDSKTGKELIAEKISKLDHDLDYDQLSGLTLKELVKLAEKRNISSEKLFSRIVGTKSNKEGRELIGENKAKEIALGLINGEIVEFELDDDYNEYEIEIIANGYEYEIEIDAYTGKVLKFEKDHLDDDKYDDDNDYDDKYDDDRDDDKQDKKANPQRIGAEKAKEIALKLVNGKIIDFELDDDEYNIEIVSNGYEYEIEIDAYTGEVLDFEKDDIDDDRDD